ncbi:MAG: S-layer homology domain-containing protein [Candidatus Margulisiibacteriota bacterium]|nr:S-layer homology domain-containing protein [Candidatus Margulisiibacteriota bacterium]
MKKFLILLIGLSVIVSPSFAELKELGINPLRLELGSRPLGMGGAFTAISDVNSVLYNPGGLAWAKGVSLTYQDPQNLSFLQAYPNGEGSSAGLAILKKTYSGIPFQIGEANSGSTIVLLSYGTKLNAIPRLYKNPFFKRFGIGITLKGLVGQTLRRTGYFDRSATGWDIDLGVIWKGGEWWSAGAALHNILPINTLGGGAVIWDVGGEEGIPASFRFGSSAKIIGDLDAPIFMEDRELILSGEIDFSRIRTSQLKLGGEWYFQKRFYLRSGIVAGDETDINLGAGFRREDWGIDLAYYREPIKNERYISASLSYYPKEWVVLKKLDIAKPTVMLERPIEELSLEDNIVTYDDRIEINGRVKPGVKVYINGLPASLDKNNAFKVVVPLRLKKNLIIVEARYEGERKVWKYKVFRKAKIKVLEEEQLKKKLKEAKSAKEKAALEAKEKEIARKKNRVESFVTMGVIEITPESEFVMEAQITRGELATWLVRAAGMRIPEVKRDLYKDVPKDHPLAPYIKAVTDMKLLQPFPDGTFRPGAFVSKQEGEEIFKRFGR